MPFAYLASGISIKRNIYSNLTRGNLQKLCRFNIQWIFNFQASFSSFMTAFKLQERRYTIFYLINAQFCKFQQVSNGVYGASNFSIYFWLIILTTMFRAHYKIIPKLTSINHFYFSTSAATKRSYYQILQLNPNFTQKQLRKSFLAKARKYHPDHNKSPDAVQQFKLLKQAYQTLKDAQKRHMYDSGVGETSQEVAPVHNSQVKMGRKYYENKWYGYQKPNNEDTRDEYYKAKAEFFHQKPVNPLKYVATFTIIVVALFGYDFLSTFQTDKSLRARQAKTVIDNSVASDKQTKKQILLQRYMQRRAEANKADL